MFGGAKATSTLESAKTWLTAHNAAVMAVLFLVFGVDLIAKGLPQPDALSSGRLVRGTALTGDVREEHIYLVP